MFDAQVSFNLLPSYGEDAKQKSETVEQRIERHLATLLARDSKRGAPLPMPSLRLVHAPIFHGYTFSTVGGVYLRRYRRAVAQVIQSEQIEVRSDRRRAALKCFDSGPERVDRRRHTDGSQ